MTIENLPAFFDMQVTQKGDRFSADLYLYNDQTFQTLNYAVYAVNGVVKTYVQKSDENPYGLNPVPKSKELVIIGLTPPSFTTAQINAISAGTNPDGSAVVPVGTMWYNSSLDKLQFKGASAVQTITSV